MEKLVETEEEIMLADAARGFLDGAAPLTHLRGLRDAGLTHDPALWKDMAAMGWAGILVPETAGGSDMGHAAAGVLEMGLAGGGIFRLGDNITRPHILAGRLVALLDDR